MSESTFDQILSEVRSFAESANDLASLQNFIVEIIPQRLPYYNWTGFYMLDPNDPETLVDIDSHDRKAFGAEDRSFLEACATLIGEFLEKSRRT
jgi:putative methionine-R-sulfoxide reductase with GAF domain